MASHGEQTRSGSSTGAAAQTTRARRYARARDAIVKEDHGRALAGGASRGNGTDGSAERTGGSTRGSDTFAVVPRLASLTSDTSPPWRWTISRTMASPRPA